MENKMETLYRIMQIIHKKRKRGYSYRDLESWYGGKWHHTTIRKHYRIWLSNKNILWKIRERFF